MSATMKANILMKVLKKFDADAEVKINKIPNRDGGYHWTFSGVLDGSEKRFKLTRYPNRYVLKTVITQDIEEIYKIEGK